MPRIRKFSAMLAVAMLAAFMLPFVTGCNGAGSIPPPSYIEAHRGTHDKAKRVYEGYATARPDEAEATMNLYQSEELLIRNAEKGVYPNGVRPTLPGSTATPAPVTPAPVRPVFARPGDPSTRPVRPPPGVN